MIEDDVIREVRAVREEFARLHDFNIRAMVADLQARNSVGDWPVVSRSARRHISGDSSKQMQQQTEATAPVSQIPKSSEATLSSGGTGLTSG